MKIADCDCTASDYVAWYKYKVSFEEKTVRALVLVILLGAAVSMFGSLKNDFSILLGSIVIVCVGAGAWCLYCRVRLERELRQFKKIAEGKRSSVRFTKHGIYVNRDCDGYETFCSFKRIVKAREIPWFLFLFVDGEDIPLIIDKRKIKTDGSDSEPYFIAKKLREQSPNYKYVKGSDLTFVGKYRGLLPRE